MNTPSYLMIDLGNTRIKASFSFDKSYTAPIVASDTLEACRSFFKANPHTKVAYVRSGKLPNAWKSWLEFSNAMELNASMALPIQVAYKSPKTLGGDRLAGACAAATEFPGLPVLTIGCGTALTTDFIDPSAIYAGGSISPGLQMRFNALKHFTEKLPKVSLARTQPKYIGNTTDSCIKSGVFYGICAEIIDRISRLRLMYPDLKVVLTGGDAALFESKLNTSIFVRPNWVFEGLLAVLIYHEQIHKG